jgi:hypothetical protein
MRSEAAIVLDDRPRVHDDVVADLGSVVDDGHGEHVRSVA